MEASRRLAEGTGLAPVFAALGDETRILLLARLCEGSPQSISQLTQGLHLTRQAITKHLRVLECAGVVRSVRTGREHQFAFRPGPINDIKLYLDQVSREWDHALGRLQTFVDGGG